MKTKLNVSIFIAILLCSILTACTGTPTTTAQTSNSPTTTTQATQSIGLSNNYAFIRNKEVWLALNGASPKQVTQFNLRGTDNWSNLHWLNNDRYLAFTLDTVPRGGNICPSDFVAGQLFIIDTQTMQVTPAPDPNGKVSQLTSDRSFYSGPWQLLGVEDNTHVLMWINKINGGNMAGLYRYDITSQKSTLLIPHSSLPALQNATYATVQYKNNQLYYEVVTPPNATGKNEFVLYSHSITQPSSPSTKLFTAGSEVYCNIQAKSPPDPFQLPAWDISNDGRYLTTQTIIDNGPTTLATSKIELTDLHSHTTSTISQNIPADILAKDVHLTWSPDRQNILLTQYAKSYLLSRTTATTNSYSTPYLTGALWHPTSLAFTATTGADTQLFKTDNTAGTILLKDAKKFSWGNN